MKKIPWWDPRVESLEAEMVQKVLQSQYLNDGNVTEDFERAVAKVVGAKFGIATTSGTSALFLTLKAMGIGHGDEVIVPDITFIATSNAVTLTGATPVHCDIDPTTMNMSPKSFKAAITSRTKAVMPVHVSGRPANMPEIVDIARTKKIAVVEDAAEALASKGYGKFLGTWGNAGCFSFSPNKTVTTGQGGMIVTNDEELAQKLRAFKDQGRPKRGTGGDDEHPTAGFNFKLTNLQSAVGLGQLTYLEKRTKRLVRHYELYKKDLEGCEGIKLLPFDTKAGEVPQWVDAIVESRDELDKFLRNQNMDCRRFWFPIHTQKPYRTPDKKFEHSAAMAPKALWLPSAYTLTDEDIHAVCKQIQKFFASAPQKGAKPRMKQAAA